MEKNEVQKKTESADLTTQNQGTATKGMEVRTQNTFSRAGSITMEKSALRIEYESFNQAHVVYISVQGLRSLTGTPNFPCDVEEIQEGTDGTIVISTVGRAWRSRSGRALVIRTTQSQGEIMVPWSQFRKVLDKQVQKAVISRFTPAAIEHSHQSTEPLKSISAGLAERF